MLIKSSLERKVLGGLGLASIIIAGVTLSYHLGTEHLVASNGRVWQSYALLRSLGNVEHGLKKLRMATRGYVQNGDADTLLTVQAGRAEAEKALNSLRNEANDLHLPGSVLKIEKLSREQLIECAELIRMRDSGGGMVATLYSETELGQATTEPLRHAIDHLQRLTHQQLNESERLAQGSHVVMFVILLLGAAIELAFAVAAAGVIRRDVLERKHANEAVVLSERTLRSFYESGVTMMGMVELLEDDVKFISMNGATAEVYGRKAEEMVGKTARQAGSPPHVLKLYIEKLQDSFRRNGAVEFEYERETPQGKKWLSAVVCPIQRWAAAQQQPRFSYVIVDITARKTATEALRQHAAELTAAKNALEEARTAADAANAAKSNFLANMSHEIRTPMTAVVGYADLLAEPGRSDAERGEWVSVIRRNARHLLELINDILDLSKIEAGKMTLESTPCDPRQIINDVLAMMRPRALEKHIRVQLEQESQLPAEINADPLRLRQVLANLVGNAIKFTEAGEVTVHVECEACISGSGFGDLHIAVRDTGIGMDQAQIDRLFRPFTQADETTTRRFGGTGLGLTITHRLVQMMGGTIEVKSEVSIGSTFELTLPIAIGTTNGNNGGKGGTSGRDVPRLPSPAEPPVAVAASRGRILMAEDGPDMQRLMSFLLTRSGAEVTVVSNGVTALEAAAGQNFDVILLDMQMPEMDGYTAARELRRRGIQTPIIAVTAHAMTGDRERCLAAGCSDYLTKPIDAAELLRRVEHYLTNGNRASGATPKATAA
jgi:PAS domain S-box-containing protein